MKRWYKCAAVLMALALLCGLLPLGVPPVAAASVNRIQNGDFENQLDGWTVHQSTVKVSTTAKYEDAYGLVAKGNGGWDEVVSQSIQLTPNSDYIIRYTVKAVSNGVNFVVSDPVGIAAGNQHARLYTSYYSTSKQRWNLHTDHRNNRHKCIAQSMLINNLCSPNPLRTSSSQIILLQNLQH